MRLTKAIIIGCCLMPLIATAQREPRWGGIDLSPAGVNYHVNSKLQSVATGTGSGTALTNFASFDPANGSFIFKGTKPLTADTSRTYMYVSLRLEGDLISDSYAALFKNSALNTGTTADIQLHFRFQSGLRRYYAFGTEEARLRRSKTNLMNWRNRSMNTINAAHDPAAVTTVLTQYEFSVSHLQFRIQDLQAQKNQRVNRLKEELLKLNPEAATVNLLTGEINTLELQLNTLNSQLKDTRAKIDSVTLLQADLQAFQVDALNQLDSKFNDSLEAIERKTQMAGLRFTWFTLTLGGARKSFHTFNGSQPFGEQLKREEFETFRIGLAVNYYTEDIFPSKVFYGNAGFLVYRDNNLRFLSTKQLSQEKVVKNALGDTTRKITKTYTVYEDPVNATQVTSLYANLYFMNKAKTFAFHVFPGYDFIKDENDITNIGIGVLTSFRNEKKERPALNVEGYIKFNDVFHKHPGQSSFWNRNEIGVNFSIPINLFK